MIINNIEYVTINEAAKLVNKSHITIRHWIKIGILPATKFSPHKIFVKKEDALNLTK